jgi:hypothetical protein
MIRKFLQRLIGWPCDHKWELVAESHCTVSLLGRTTYNGPAFLYRCPACCKHKTVFMGRGNR